MSKILGTITAEGFTCSIHEDGNGRVHFVADADIDADGANGQNDQSGSLTCARSLPPISSWMEFSVPSLFKPCSNTSLEDKFTEALRRTAPKLPGSMHHEFEALLSPTSLGIMAGSLVVWAGSHAFGVGEVVDIVLLAGGADFLGMAVFDVSQELGHFLVVTSTAAVEKDLDEAASHLARAIAIMGIAAFIAAFIALLAKLARGKSGGKGAAEEVPKKPIEERPQSSRPKSPPKPQPETPEPKPQPKTPVKFGKRGIYTEPGTEPPTLQLKQEMDAAALREKLPPPEKAGWPQIPSKEAATFKALPEPVELSEGTKLYRVIDSESNQNGSYWTIRP